MTTTDDRPEYRPAPDCPNWCTYCDLDEVAGTRMHGTATEELPSHAPEEDRTARVWAISERGDSRVPTYCLQVEMTAASAAQVRATAAGLLALVDRYEPQPTSAGPLTRAQADHLLDLAQAARDEARDPAEQGRAWDAFVMAAYGLTARP